MIVETTSLTVKTSEGKPLLKNVNLKVDKGETVLLCGQPGSGKTVLCKALKDILPGNFEVTGKVNVKGESGFLFQSPKKQIVREKVISDLAFGLENEGIQPREIKERIEKYAEVYNLTDFLERETKELSSGEAAKVALVGVLVTEPDILILDEPLSMLDSPNKKMMIDQINKIKKQGKTLIIAEHDIKDLFPIVDRIVLLKNGRIRTQGKPKEIISELYSEGVRLPLELELKAEVEKDG